MKKHRFLLGLLSLCLAALLCGCGRQPALPKATVIPSPETPETPETPEEPDPALPEEPDAPDAPEEDPVLTRARAILADMTEEQKLGQVFFARRPAGDAAAFLEQYPLGGYLLFRRDLQDAQGNWLTREAFLAQMEADRQAAEIPMFFGTDEEGGTVCRVSQNPELFAKRFASPQKLFRQGGLDAVRQDAAGKSAALLALGININFAPVADVSTQKRDYMYDRAFGQDAQATADYVTAVVEEMERAGIGSVLKHFPGYGSNGDTHTAAVIDRRTREQLDECDLVPFAAGIRAGATAVLVSHNIVECMDDTLPASLSPEVHRVLREELGFDGLILTDDLAMDAVKDDTENGSAAVLALQAGNDMVVTSDPAGDIAAVRQALEQGELTWEQIETACLRVLQAKLRLGILPMEPQEKNA